MELQRRIYTSIKWLIVPFVSILIAEPTGWPPDYPVQLVSVEMDSIYDQLFQANESGWLGADAATSIVLSETRTLWLFGDAFLGDVIDGKRIPNRFFINSTIAIQDRTAPPLQSIRYYWRREGARDIAFFPYQTGSSGEYYWPTSGVRIGDKLVVFCFALHKDWGNGWVAGTISVVIDNPDDEPMDWKLSYYDMNIGNDHFGIHSAVYYEKPYLYFFGWDDPDDDNMQRRTILMRAKATDILKGRNAEVLEFWAQGKRGLHWQKNRENLVSLFVPGVTEMAIQYDAQWGLYYCTTYVPEKPDIFISVAHQLTGSWSEPVRIYSNPEHKRMTYAAKCHPELSNQPGELVISYITAPIGVDIENQGMDVYRPRFIRARLRKKD